MYTEELTLNLVPRLFNRRTTTTWRKEPGEAWSRVSQNMGDNEILSRGMEIGTMGAMLNCFVYPTTFLEFIFQL